jgi:enterochelin esterase-like enzyme
MPQTLAGPVPHSRGPSVSAAAPRSSIGGRRLRSQRARESAAGEIIFRKPFMIAENHEGGLVMRGTHRKVFVAAAALAATGAALAQAPQKGSLERIEVHGASLEGNLEGDDPTRDVFVYLPASYANEPARRYPVVYFLHGYTATAEAYVRLLGLPDSADAVMAGGARETILVLPDAFTVWSGSMYSSSPTTGDWEAFVASDLVAYIDAHYRTIPNRDSRGLSGHSMGGYGTMRIGMKHPEVFGALYAMSSCCLMNDAAQFRDAVLGALRERAASGEVTPPKPDPSAGFANALSAQAAAWAPNPDNPPLYFDLPFSLEGDDPVIAGKWAANSPLVFVDQYVPSLKRYKAIALDVGDADGLSADNRRLDAALTRLGIEHSFELYEGNHVNRVARRFREKVLPFFSAELEFGNAPGVPQPPDIGLR